jgi:hypothetical protein
MKAIHLLPVFLLVLFIGGCAAFRSELVRDTRRMIVVTEHATTYALNADGTAGPAAGTFEAHTGDTIVSYGSRYGGIMEPSYILVASRGVEVYVKAGDVLTEDDHLWRRVGPSFRLTRAEDQTAWGRAISYVVHQTGNRIEHSSYHLIQTEAPVDSTSVGYLVTRIPAGNWVEYQITCRSKRKGFDSTEAAHKLAFYMASGREYR